MRYRLEPPSITDRVKILEARLRTLESKPRTAHTAIDDGDLVLKSDTADISIYDSNGDIAIQIVLFADIGFVGIVYLPDAVNVVGSFFSATSFDMSFDNISQTIGFLAMYPPLSGGNTNTLSVGQTVSNLLYEAQSLETSYFQVRDLTQYGYTGNLRIVGRWLNNTQMSTSDALHTGTQDISAGVSSATITYASSFSSTMAPIVGLLNSAGALTWNLTAQSASSFTVAWSGTLAKTINWWSIRL